MTLLLVILAIIFPPLGVGLKVGLSGTFWLNVILTILGYVPGIIHALFVVLSRRG
ncbi:MAG TPA: YqaE/Pmp3 family membrane protein [Nocardioidaceae bacterium]|nr:YqaE/Pmp3 family membrane protein [Nocardioidaceae bacterium]